jgi:hypothetical protein
MNYGMVRSMDEKVVNIVKLYGQRRKSIVHEHLLKED